MIEAMIVAGIGGFFGSCGRYLTGVAAKRIFGNGFPAGTFICNVLGCFIIGLFFGFFDRGEMSKMVNALLITGFCGGYTTFSSFSHDSYSLITSGQWKKFILYVVPSIILGIFMVWLGMQCV